MCNNNKNNMKKVEILLLLQSFTSLLASDCGTLTLSPKIVRENESVELVYNYVNRYEHRLWYRLRGKEWTKLYDSTNSQSVDQKYNERFYDNSYILTLPAVTLNDAGNYVVFCSTITNRASQYVELKVLPQNMKQGLCGRLDIRPNGSPLGSLVQFIFQTNASQSDVMWQVEVQGQFINIGLDLRAEYTKNLAHTLFVRKLYSRESDKGTYRVLCADGTVSNIVELTVNIVPPSKPVIKNVTSYPGCSNCLLAVPGQYLRITCHSYNGSAPVDLKLYVNNVKINEAVSSEVTYRLITVEKSQLIRQTHDNAVVRCSAENAAADQPLVTEARIYLFREPDPPLITNYIGIEGKTANITCISVGGKPAPNIRFVFKNRVIRPETKTSLNETTGTTRVDSVIQMNLTREDNLMLIECRSDILDSLKTASKVLSVKFPPTSLSVSKVKQTTTVIGNANLTLQCTVGESNPKSTVVWQGLDTMIRSESHGKDKFDAGDNGGWIFKHEITLPLSKEDNRKKIRCAALNTEFPNLILEKSYQVNVPYQPITSITGGQNVTVIEGSDVKITCSVDSNPKSDIRWIKGDGEIDSAAKDISSLDLILYNISSRDHSSVYTCSAGNGVGGEVVQNITIFVKDQSLAYHRVSRSEGDGGTIAGIICGFLIVIAIAIILVFAIRRRRLASKCENTSTVQIRFEDRQPSIQPQVDEPVYNNVNPAVKATVSEEPAVYAKVIPKSQRQDTTVLDEDMNNAEYATVIPRSQRHSSDDVIETSLVPKGTDNLVYADLDLQASNMENKQNKQNSPRTQRTEYVTIDFTKSQTKNENNDIE